MAPVCVACLGGTGGQLRLTLKGMWRFGREQSSAQLSGELTWGSHAHSAGDPQPQTSALHCVFHYEKHCILISVLSLNEVVLKTSFISHMGSFLSVK